MFRKAFLPVLTLLIAFLLTSCHSAQRYVESGSYDDAIDLCLRKLQGRKKKKDEFVRGLEMAFKKAQARDLATIEHLDGERRPDNWDRINDLHRDIAERQNKVAPLMPLVSKDGYRARFEFVNIGKLEQESRRKAADHLYGQAETLLADAQKGDKRAARQAYDKIRELERRYFRDYRESAKLLQEARRLGTSYVLFEVKNQSDKLLPKAFADRLLAIGKRDLDSEWKSYFFEPQAGIQFDYRVVFKVRRVELSPERVHEREYTDEKDIQDGWDYVLDERGNVKKDTAGNDIKTPHWVRIRAIVLEARQMKSARLGGQIEIFEAGRNTLLDSDDLSTEVLFDHYASTFRGDARALSDDSRRCTGSRPLPFPTDEDLLLQAAERLKPNLRDALRSSRAIL